MAVKAKDRCKSKCVSGLGTLYQCSRKKGHTGYHSGQAPYKLRDGSRPGISWTDEQARKFGTVQS